MRSYLIVWTSEKTISVYNEHHFVVENKAQLNQLRRMMDFIDYQNYKGFGREHLTSHPFYPVGQGGGLEELQENKTWDNLVARRKLADFEYGDTQQEFSFKSIEDAKKVYRLIEDKDNFEIIEISEEKGTDTKTLGFDIGTWWTAYSLIADTFVIPMWHPPDFNDFNDILKIGQQLNKFCLFDRHEDAQMFAEAYLKKDW